MKKNTVYWIILVTVVAILSVLLTGLIINNSTKDDIAYTDLIAKISNNEVQKVEMTVGSTSAKVYLKNDPEKKYNTILPSVQAFVEYVQDEFRDNSELNLELKENQRNFFVTLSSTIFSMLPTLLLVVLIIMVFKMQGLGDKGKVYGAETDNKTNTTFDDVAGLDEEKHELFEIVDFLKKPEKYQKMGAKIPRGILLCGKPGTGKTLIAKAIAGEANVPFISMSGSEFI